MIRFSKLGYSLFLTLTLAVTGAILVSGCTQDQPTNQNPGTPDPQMDFISATKLKNCHFQNAAPSYTFNSTITPNPIICAEGVAKSVQLLTPSPLPSGIQFSMDQLSLTGTANEKVIGAPYQFWIENEAGYAI